APVVVVAPPVAPLNTAPLVQALNISEPAAKALAEIFGATFGKEGVVTQVALDTVRQAGFILPNNLKIGTEAFASQLLREVDRKTDSTGKDLLRNELVTFLQKLGFSPISLQELKGTVPLDVAFKAILQNELASIINRLGIRLDRLPQDVRRKIEEIVSKGIPELKFLSKEQKSQVVVALALGVLKGNQATAAITALTALDQNGITSKGIIQVINAIRPAPVPVPVSESALEASAPPASQAPIIATAQPGDTRGVATLPPDFLEKFQDAFNKFNVDHTDKKFAVELVSKFADFTIKQKDFYQFSISMLLDPANFFLKNYSLATAEKGKGGQSQSPLQMVV
ncbi:MAG TPA: hypothetical protein VN457_02590, partial [Chlamydiales bacterium]|nr:hypothetical protein [Chlamydiales bacterium]